MTEKIIFINTQGFSNKKEKINKIVETHKPTVLVIAEHFQSDEVNLDKISGYKLSASFLRGRKERGGVAIFVKVNLKYELRQDLDIYGKKKEFEVASVEIPSLQLVVTAVYRPPSSSITAFNNKIKAMLDLYLYGNEKEKFHVMAGDFNINNTNRNTTQDILQEKGFSFMLSTKTHDHGACLDNFAVDFEPSKTKVMRSRIDRLSDHRPIELILPSLLKKATSNHLDLRTMYRISPRIAVSDDSSSDDDSTEDYSDVRVNPSQLDLQLSDLMLGMSLVPNSRSKGKSSGKERKRH